MNDDLELVPQRNIDLQRDHRYDTVEEVEDTPRTWKPPTPEEQKLLDLAMERWGIASEGSETEQRLRELEDLKFDRAHIDDQWPADQIAARRAEQKGNQTTTARPTLVISRLDQPIYQVINEARRARLAIDVKPKGRGANEEGATLRQGMIRAIEMDSRALNARLWALERAVKCGRGYYRIVKEFANDGDFEMDLVVKAIPNQGAVYLDPYVDEPDASDAEWGFLIEDLPPQHFRRRFPKARLSDAAEFETIGNLQKSWVNDQNIRIAEYYYREYEDRELLQIVGAFPDNSQYDNWKGHRDELPAALHPLVPDTAKRRPIKKPCIYHAFITAGQVLEKTKWEGRYIPIIRVCGKRYNVEGKWSYQGIIFKAKDAQRSYNYMRSAQVEAVALAPRATWIIDPKQIAGYTEIWATAHVKNWAWLPARAFDDNGNAYPAPARPVVSPEIEGITLAVREAENDIKAVTGRSDPSLGMYSRDRSGKAIQQLQQQGELGSSNYLDELANSMNLEARQLLDMLRHVYDTQGRIVRLLGDGNDEEMVMLGTPFVTDPKSKLPLPADQMPPPGGPPPGAPPQQAPPQPPGLMARMGGAVRSMLPAGMGGGRPPEAMPPDAMPMAPSMAAAGQQPPPLESKLYRLDDDGDYGVVVSVSQQYANQREEDRLIFEALFEANPELWKVLGDLYFETREGPAMKKAAERLRALNPALQQEAMQGLPPQAVALIQQLQAQNQELQQLADDNLVKKHQIDTDRAMREMELQVTSRSTLLKLQVEVEKMKGTNASREKIAQLQAEVDVLEQQMESATAEKIAVLKANLEERRADNDRKRDDHAAVRDDHFAERADSRAAQQDDRAAMRDAQIGEHSADRQVDRDEQTAESEFRRTALLDQHQTTRDASLEEDAAEKNFARDEAAARRDAEISEAAAEAQRAHDVQLARAKPPTKA